MINSRVEVGHISRFWGDDFKTLPFVKQPITRQEIDSWRSQGYDYVKSFSGSMYDNSNPMPSWISNMENLLGMYNQTYTIYRMDTLEIMPAHRDHYNTYCKIHDTTPENVQRAIVMLEDWKPGHYFELDGVGYVNWKAGDWFKWSGDIPHAASNIGIEPRYTLQVTGTSIFSGQLNKLFFSNVPDINDNCFHPLLKDKILPKVPEKHVMFWMNNGYISALDDITHSSNGIEILNKEGLHIYLYEPICSYHKDATVTENIPYSKHNQGFYSEFTHPINPEELRCESFESIYNYAKINNLTNITVHTCDYNVDQYYTYYTDVLNLICDDLFLKSQTKINNINEIYVNQFDRKFICLNWRFTNHRQLVATFLAADDGYLSWHHKADFYDLTKNLPFDLNLWEQTHIKHYCKLRNNCDIVMNKSPYTVDLPADDAILIDNPYSVNIWPNVDGFGPNETPALRNIVSNSLESAYANSFVDIINETRFAQPTANFSEKVFQAIQYQKPFIVVGPPKTLEYIKSLGFKTFNDFWDEEYDDELNHGERLAKIFDLITEIINTPIEDLRELYENMRPIIEHNLLRHKEFLQ